MRRVMLIVIMLVSFLMLTGENASACLFRQRRCCPQRSVPLHFESAPRPLTAESARQALIEMLGRDGAPNFDTRTRELAALKKGQNLLIMEKNAEGIQSGLWNCDLDEKRFWFICQIGSCLYKCNGDFQYTNGQWHARVGGESWGYLGPKGK